MIAEDAERALLLCHLNAHRTHSLEVLDDIDDAHLRRPALPSGWRCRWLVLDSGRSIDWPGRGLSDW